jgi:hypothetical protein
MTCVALAAKRSETKETNVLGLSREGGWKRVD